MALNQPRIALLLAAMATGPFALLMCDDDRPYDCGGSAPCDDDGETCVYGDTQCQTTYECVNGEMIRTESDCIGGSGGAGGN